MAASLDRKVLSGVASEHESLVAVRGCHDARPISLTLADRDHESAAATEQVSRRRAASRDSGLAEPQVNEPITSLRSAAATRSAGVWWWIRSQRGMRFWRNA